MIWKCPFCGNENLDDASFCTRCGAKKPDSLTPSASIPGAQTAPENGTQTQMAPETQSPEQPTSPQPEQVVEQAQPVTQDTPQESSQPAEAVINEPPTVPTNATQQEVQLQQPLEQKQGRFYLQFINTPNPQFNKTKIPLEFDVFPSISLGRSPENVIVIPDPEVSRKHAIISYEGGKLEIEDLNSTNGTYIYDGKMFQPVKGKAEIGPNSVLKLANNTVIKVVKE